MNITKRELSVLRYIYRKKTVTHLALIKKYKSKTYIDELLENLIRKEYLYCVQGSYNQNGDLVSFTDSTTFQLDTLGAIEVENHQWFNGQYILSYIVVPIIVGLTSSIITALLL